MEDHSSGRFAFFVTRASRTSGELAVHVSTVDGLFADDFFLRCNEFVRADHVSESFGVIVAAAVSAKSPATLHMSVLG